MCIVMCVVCVVYAWVWGMGHMCVVVCVVGHGAYVVCGMCVCVCVVWYVICVCVCVCVHAQASRNTRQTCLKGNEEVPETVSEYYGK